MIILHGNIKKSAGGTIQTPRVYIKTTAVQFSIDAEQILTVSNLDTGSVFQFGFDYYIYAGLESGSGIPVLKISLNPSTPVGLNSPFMIGGFHYGKIRNSFTIADVSDGILPASVWDLNRMPTCYKLGIEEPTVYQIGGMVEVIPNALWADIYLASDGGGSVPNARVQSKINQYPMVSKTWYDCVNRGRAVGKRLLNYAEWTAAALGSPQGLDDSNLHGWTKTSNTGRVKTAATEAADADTDYINGYNTSLLGARDCVGNVYEWVADLSNRHDTTSWAWQDVLDAGELASLGEYGQAYLPNADGLVAYLVGGSWYFGVHAGARTVFVYNHPWNVYSFIGCRFGCGSL